MTTAFAARNLVFLSNPGTQKAERLFGGPPEGAFHRDSTRKACAGLDDAQFPSARLTEIWRYPDRHESCKTFAGRRRSTPERRRTQTVFPAASKTGDKSPLCSVQSWFN